MTNCETVCQSSSTWAVWPQPFHVAGGACGHGLDGPQDVKLSLDFGIFDTKLPVYVGFVLDLHMGGSTTSTVRCCLRHTVNAGLQSFHFTRKHVPGMRNQVTARCAGIPVTNLLHRTERFRSNGCMLMASGLKRFHFNTQKHLRKSEHRHAKFEGFDQNF